MAQIVNHSNQTLQFCDDCTPSQVFIEPRDYRALAYCEFKSGSKRDECYERLSWHFGENGPTRGTVCAWYTEFRRESHPQPQGPTLDSELMEATCMAHQLIERNKRIEHEALRKKLALSQQGLQRVLAKELGLARRHSRWVPLALTDEQRLARVEWCQRMLGPLARGRCVAVDELPLARSSEHEPTVRTLSVVAFFTQAGHMLTAVVQSCYPANDDQANAADDKWYSVRCLPDGHGSRAHLTGKRRLLLRYARYRKTAKTLVLRSGYDADFIGDPPNSPDLLPADFAVYPRVGETLTRRSFKGRDDVAVAYDAAVRDIKSADWKRIFNDWLFRVKACVATQGDYFEEA